MKRLLFLALLLPSVLMAQYRNDQVNNLTIHGYQDVGAADTFAASDATPSVIGNMLFNSSTTSVTITDFDAGATGTLVEGHLILVVSKGNTTYDCTSSGLLCGTTDIATTSGDVTSWLYDGADWQLLYYKNDSTDMGSASETNDLEATDPPTIENHEVYQGTASGAGAFVEIPDCNSNQMLTYTQSTNTWGCDADDGAGSGAPIAVNYLVGTADATLSAELLVTDGQGVDTVVSAGNPGSVVFDFMYTDTLSGDPAFTAKECVFVTEGTSGGGFLCEGTTANSNEQLYLFPAVDGADTTSFVCVDGTQVTDLEGTALSITAGTLNVTEGNDLSAAVTWDDVPDANVDGASERDEVCDTTSLSSSCEINTAVIGRTQIDETLLSVQTHATDCTSLTCDAASDGEMCFENDDNELYTCNGDDTTWYTGTATGDISQVLGCLTGDCSDISFDESDSLNADGITLSTTDEGIIVTTASDCDALTGLSTGVLCYDTTDDSICVFDGSVMDCQILGAVASGDVTDVGDCTGAACFTGANGTLLQSNTDLIMELDEDNNGSESFQVKDGADNIVGELDEAGALTVESVADIDGPGTLWEVDAFGDATFNTVTTANSATPGIDWTDSDTTDEDISVALDVNCTDTGSGTEDCDFTLSQQIAGSSTAFITADADGSGSARLLLPTDSIGSTEILDGDLLEADLKAVDSPADEECLTYESTGGDFEWQSCGAGGAGESNTASNVGGGLANFNQKTAVDLEFNSFDSDDFDLGSNLISIDQANWLAEVDLDTIAELNTQIADATICQLDGTNCDATQAELDLKAALASPTFTGTVTMPTPFTLGAVSVLPTGTELNYVNGVTSAIQTQIDAKAPSASPTFTTSMAIPQGTGPTVDAAGEIAFDTTALPTTGGEGQLVVHDGSSGSLSIPVAQSECAKIENLAASDDDYGIWTPPFAVTVTSAWCTYQGTGSTAATVDFSDAEGNAMTMTDATCADADSSTRPTPQAITAANALVAYESLAFNVTNAVDPETDEYIICWTYTVATQ